MGYFRTLPADEGECVSPPPPPSAICQTTGPIVDPKTAFDSSEPQPSEYVPKNCLKVTDDVTDEVESKLRFFTSGHRWLRRAKQPHQVETKPMKGCGSCLGYF